MMLQYWPRVDTMRGCTAALDTDALLGENMCSSEAEDLMVLHAQEARQFPMRCVAAVVLGVCVCDTHTHICVYTDRVCLSVRVWL